MWRVEVDPAHALDRRQRRDPRPRARLGPLRGRHELGLPHGPPVPPTHRRRRSARRRDAALGARPDFDLHYHVRRLRLPEGAGTDGLFTFAEQAAMTPFDPSRPLWEATLVGGLPDGGAALLFKLTTSSPTGWASRSSWPGCTRAPGSRPPTSPSRPRRRARPRPLSPGARAAGPQRRSGWSAGPQRGLLGVAASLVRPDRAVRDALGYVVSARRVLSPPPATPLPLLAHRSPSWRFRSPRRAVRRPARGGEGGRRLDQRRLPRVAARGVPALLTPARATRCPPERLMPVALPVSVRREEHEAGGNHFAPRPARRPGRHRRPGGADRRRPAAHEGRAAEPALESVEVVTPWLARLPGSVITGLGAGTATGANDLQASNIPGLQDDIYPRRRADRAHLPVRAPARLRGDDRDGDPRRRRAASPPTSTPRRSPTWPAFEQASPTGSTRCSPWGAPVSAPEGPYRARRGRGEPLVLLHGASMSWRAWRPVLSGLEEHHDVLVPTMIGHRGGAPWPEGEPVGVTGIVDDVESLMDAAGHADRAPRRQLAGRLGGPRAGAARARAAGGRAVAGRGLAHAPRPAPARVVVPPRLGARRLARGARAGGAARGCDACCSAGCSSAATASRPPTCPT